VRHSPGSRTGWRPARGETRAVADRGLLSLDNIQALQAIELGEGRAWLQSPQIGDRTGPGVSPSASLAPEHALAQLKRIHRHRIKVNDRELHGVSTLTKDQTDLLAALTLQTPTKHEQLSLL
jgi:hypothetical protein